MCIYQYHLSTARAVHPDPDPHLKSSWTRIRIEKNCWIQIRIRKRMNADPQPCLPPHSPSHLGMGGEVYNPLWCCPERLLTQRTLERLGPRVDSLVHTLKRGNINLENGRFLLSVYVFKSFLRQNRSLLVFLCLRVYGSNFPPESRSELWWFNSLTPPGTSVTELVHFWLAPALCFFHRLLLRLWLWLQLL